MATNGVISFKTKRSMMRVVVGCDGHTAVRKILVALANNELSERNYLKFVKQQKIGCFECLRIGRIKNSQKRFTNPRWCHTANETLTINFVKKVVELSKSSDFQRLISTGESDYYMNASCDVSEARMAKKKLLKKGWTFTNVFLPSTNKEAEQKAKKAPLLNSWN